MGYQAKEVPPYHVLWEVYSRGAATIKELKEFFNTDSSSIRKSLGHLMIEDKVWLIGSGKAIFVMVNAGTRGAPSPYRARQDANDGVPPMPKYGVPLNPYEEEWTSPKPKRSRVKIRIPDDVPIIEGFPEP